MAIKPILFNTEMVRAILDGKKTQTRRVIKDRYFDPLLHMDLKFLAPVCAGDILWVRETWCNLPVSPGGHTRLSGRYYYKADNPDIRPDGWRGNWKPSIHMPKAAARIFLRVTNVRCERLCEIDEEGVCAEGAEQIITGCEHMDYSFTPPETCFNANPCKDCIINHGYPELFGKMVWNKTLKPADVASYGWDANPWVWVIEFERTEQDTPF